MSLECQTLTGWVSIQELSPLGCINKQVQYKNIQLSLGRDEYNEIILRLDLGKCDKKYMLREIQIFKKFVKDGKATVKMPDRNIQLMLSNCPPDKLILFLKTMATKLQCKKKTGFTSDREKLRACIQRTFQEISPLTMKDLRTAQGLSPVGKRPKCSHSTPNAKRKSTDADKENVHPSKRQCPSDKISQRVVLHPVKLTKEQLRVLEVVVRGESLFFTGSAGTGKSFLLRRILGSLPPDHTFATASTGVAACQIGGTTLHSFAGIGSGKGTIETCAELARRPAVMQQWKKCRHLIIDEISMVDGEFFDKMECVARMIRGNDKPFGGIQLVVCGDFLQLPPVTKKSEKRKFCFQSRAWRKCIRTSLELTEVKRQDDKKFIHILQNIRKGRCPDFVVSALEETVKNCIQTDGIQATRLCTHKEDVDFINKHELNNLKGISHTFTATCNNEYLSECSSVDHCPVVMKLQLKVGTQVMVTKNIDVSNGLVNGARGVITAFEKGSEGWPVVRFMSGKKHCVKPVRWVTKSSSSVTVWKQLPLKLAWAISIHKSQGMTLDCVEMSLSRVFESGQAYVALSRAKSLKGLKVLNFDRSCVRADPDVLKFYSSLELCNPDKENQTEGFFF